MNKMKCKLKLDFNLLYSFTFNWAFDELLQKKNTFIKLYFQREAELF